MKNVYNTQVEKISDLESLVDTTVGISDWIQIEQKNIDTFAEATLDKQWIYTDEVAAEQYSPYGAPVAHGFLILSLIPKFTYESLHINDAEMAVNYGLDRVRFPHAVTVGAYIRGKVEIKEYRPLEGGAMIMALTTVEIKDQEKPACVAEFIFQVYNETLERE